MHTNPNKHQISIVVPTYKGAESLKELHQRIEKTFDLMDFQFELLIVNDHSPHNDWQIVCQIAATDKRVKGINLSRNFGQHNAITAGLELAKGEWIVVMDCDLQDQPEEIKRLLEKALEGYDVVLAQRARRKDTWLKRSFSRVFYAVLGYLTDTKQDASVGNFGIYNKKVIKAILSMHDSTRYLPTMVKWVGFRSIGLQVEHSERLYGTTSYNFKRLVLLALDVILAFSYKPLKLVIKLGLGISFSAIAFAIYTIYRFINNEINVPGWSSIMVSIWFFSGLIIFLIGVVGMYVGRIFERVKDRPIYLVQETINMD